MHYTGLINQYRAFLPVTESTPVISINEGNTPLIKLNSISKTLGLEIYAKFEGVNPTGSFKDRGMTMAVTKAVEAGSKAIICASTGNTSASAAAYAARAGIKSYVLIPEGKVALGKLAQALVYGSKLIKIHGNFDDGMQIVKDITANNDKIALVNSVNPYRLEGQKTAAFEIVDALGKAPDYHALPVGNAGNISAYWLGYTEYAKKGKCDTPTMLGYQASGAAPFLRGKPVANPETIATAIRIGNPQSWDKAVNAIKQSGGKFNEVTDEQILSAQNLLASTEGIFCEPASAASIAGLIQSVDNGEVKSGASVVCTLTGNGLKDPDVVLKQHNESEITLVDAKLEAIEQVIAAN
jgi:threonine synthase